MAKRVLSRTFLMQDLGKRDGDGLMLLVSPELEDKARELVKELELKLRVELCERFQRGYWVIF